MNNLKAEFMLQYHASLLSDEEENQNGSKSNGSNQTDGSATDA